MLWRVLGAVTTQLPAVCRHLGRAAEKGPSGAYSGCLSPGGLAVKVVVACYTAAEDGRSRGAWAMLRFQRAVSVPVWDPRLSPCGTRLSTYPS